MKDTFSYTDGHMRKDSDSYKWPATVYKQINSHQLASFTWASF